MVRYWHGLWLGLPHWGIKFFTKRSCWGSSVAYLPESVDSSSNSAVAWAWTCQVKRESVASLGLVDEKMTKQKLGGQKMGEHESRISRGVQWASGFLSPKSLSLLSPLWTQVKYSNCEQAALTPFWHVQGTNPDSKTKKKKWVNTYNSPCWIPWHAARQRDFPRLFLHHVQNKGVDILWFLRRHQVHGLNRGIAKTHLGMQGATKDFKFDIQRFYEIFMYVYIYNIYIYAYYIYIYYIL